MIVSTNSHARSLLVLSKNRPQASADKPIHPLKGHRMSVLEIVKPPAERRIQIGDDFRQTVPPRALGPHPNAISKCFETLFANPAPPRFEAIAQKLKAFSFLPTVTHVGFIDTKTQPVLFYPTSYFFKRGLRLFGCLAKHHKVIGVANHAVALLLHMTVQRVKIDISQQRTDHRSLRCAARWRPSLHLLDDVLLKIRFYQLKHPPIAHLFLHALQKPRMCNGVEVALKIGIHYKGVAFSKQPFHFTKRIFAVKSRAKAVTHLKELPLKDRLQHKLKCRLNDTVFDHRNPQRTKLPAPFGNLHSSYRLWPVGSVLKSYTQFLKIHLRPCRKALHALAVYSRCAPFAFTFCHAALSVSARYTLSIRLNHFPPLAPFCSAANMRSFHTEASTHDQLRPCVCAPCVAFSGTTGAWLSPCFMVKLTLPPSYLPSLGAALLSAPLATFAASVLWRL